MSQPHVPFKKSQDQDIEAKKRLAEAPKRKSHVREASTAGDVHAVLSFIEKVHDPEEATALALDAHKYLARYGHLTALRQLEQEYKDLFGEEKSQKGSHSTDGPQGRARHAAGERAGDAPAIKYDPHTCQIQTGKLGTIRLHVDRGVDLPIRDGTLNSSDPFIRIRLWNLERTGKDTVRKCVQDVSTDTKIMTVNPIYNEYFDFHINQVACELELEVYDWDEDGTHDFMGKVILPLREFLEDIVQHREVAYKRNIEVAKSVAQTPGSRNIVGRSLGGTGTVPIEHCYGKDTAFGLVGWDAATGIKAISTGIERPSESLALLPNSYRQKLKGIGGVEDSSEGGQLVFTTTFVPAVRSQAIANVPVFPRKTLEHLTPMTPANRMLFEDKEFLHSSVAEDASWDKFRTLTSGVLWPKDPPPAEAQLETSLVMRRSLAHLTWRNMIEPTRPYKKALPAGVCKENKTGFDDVEDKAQGERRAEQDMTMRFADRLWGNQTSYNLSLKERLHRVKDKALNAREYVVRSEASKAVSKGSALFEDYKFQDALVHFDSGLRLATEG
jgi:hypothetical protein